MKKILYQLINLLIILTPQELILAIGDANKV